MACINETRKSELLMKIEHITNETDLNDVANEIEDVFTILPKNRELEDSTFNKDSSVNLNNEYEIQKFYHDNKFRALQEIISGPPSYCDVDSDIIENHYKSLFAKQEESNIYRLPAHLWPNIAPDEKENAALTTKFTSKEIKAKFFKSLKANRRSLKSKDLDGMKFLHFIQNNSDCAILTAYFNACLKIEKIPEIWKNTSAVLTNNDETNDDNDISNWNINIVYKPIPKLFLSLVASRLVKWAKNSNRLSVAQKEHVFSTSDYTDFILDECKKYALLRGKDLAVASLDFSVTYGTLSQDAVIWALNNHLIPASVENLIHNILNKTTTKIRQKSGAITNSIDILKRLPKGSPLNQILIQLVIYPILINLSKNSNGFNMFGVRINHLITFDKLILITQSPMQLRILLFEVERTTKLIGIEFNLANSFYYYQKNEIMVQTFFGQKLQVLSSEEFKARFGSKKGIFIGKYKSPTIDEIINSIQIINNSKLHQMQKIESVLFFIMPDIELFLRRRRNLNEQDFLEVDKVLRDNLKRWIGIPDDMKPEFIVYQTLRLDPKNNICYLPLIDLFYIIKIIHAFEILNSKDEQIKNIAFRSLTDDVSKLFPKMNKDDINEDFLAKYLSGEFIIKRSDEFSLWHVVCQAIVELKSKLRVMWLYTDGKMQLGFKRSKRIKTTYYSDLSEVEEKFRKDFVNNYVKAIRRYEQTYGKKYYSR